MRVLSMQRAAIIPLIGAIFLLLGTSLVEAQNVWQGQGTVQHGRVKSPTVARRRIVPVLLTLWTHATSQEQSKRVA